jgi:protein TonB
VIALLLIAFLVVCLTIVPAFGQGTGRKAINKPNPSYPELARRMGIKGRVMLKITVGADGRAKQVTPQGGHPLLVQASTEAVQKWVWEKGPEETKSVEFNFQ